MKATMRINLKCPYHEKDHAKLLGARWDAAKKVWYIVDVEDLTPFMRWIRRVPKKERESAVATPTKRSSGVVTLREFLDKHYSGALSLTRKSAKVFGIPFPLERGWASKYAHKTAQEAHLVLGSRIKKKESKRKGIHSVETLNKKGVNSTHTLHPPVRTGPKVFKPLCSCNVEPWDDCEHTDALAMEAMREMVTNPNLDTCLKSTTY